MESVVELQNQMVCRVASVDITVGDCGFVGGITVGVSVNLSIWHTIAHLGMVEDVVGLVYGEL